MIVDPVIGDIGIAVFADRDISTVKRTKAQGNPGSRRRFDAADGMYLGGLLNSAPTNYLQLSSDGSATLSSWVGMLAPFAMGAVPPGWLACPTSQTLVSTTTYARLFAVLQYAWGGSGGSFGIPYFAAGYVPVAGTPGLLTHGALLAHTHPVFYSVTSAAGSAVGTPAVSGTNTPSGSTGGTDNLAAGMGVQWCVKY